MWVNAGSSRLALCPDDAMNASITAPTLGPVPTFSPSFSQSAVMPALMGLAWLIAPAAAIWWLHERLAATSSECTVKGARPALARCALTKLTNSDSSPGLTSAELAGSAARMPTNRTATAAIAYNHALLRGRIVSR
jgi:hypothetical protein